MFVIGPVTVTLTARPLLQLEQLQVAPGSIYTLMGPSGSGKSTLLNWLAGVPLPAFQVTGTAWLDGRDITRLPAAQRRIGLKFQQAWLLPHLTVLDNLLFALPRPATASQGRWSLAGRRQQRREREQQAYDMLDSLQLTALAQQQPAQLSGGQAARVALARALINQPRAMLLDEPFAALDKATREQVRHWTYTHLRERQIPTIVVTHDAEDIAQPDQVVRFI